MMQGGFWWISSRFLGAAFIKLLQRNSFLALAMHFYKARNGVSESLTSKTAPNSALPGAARVAVQRGSCRKTITINNKKTKKHPKSSDKKCTTVCCSTSFTVCIHSSNKLKYTSYVFLSKEYLF